MFGNRARYDWPVDVRPAQVGHASLGDVSGGVEVGMELESAVPASVGVPSAVAFVGVSASRALLAGVSGVDQNDALAECFRLVSQELLKLEERPAVELRVELPASPLLDSYAFQVLKGEGSEGRLGYLLGYAMVHVSHKPSLSPRKPLELPFGGASAFGLEPLSEVCILPPTVLHTLGIEKPAVGAHGNIDNAPVYAEYLPTYWFRRFCLYRSVDVECTSLINQGGTLDCPVEVSLVILREGKGGLDSPLEGADAHPTLGHPEVHNTLVVAYRRMGVCFGELLEFECPERLASYIPRARGQAGRKTEPLPDVIVRSIVYQFLAPRPVLEAELGAVVERLVESLHCAKEPFFVPLFKKKLELESPLHIHISVLIPNKPFDECCALLPPINWRVSERRYNS